MRAWFFASWVGLMVCLTLVALVDDESTGWALMGLLALLAFGPPVIAAVSSRRNGPGDEWFLGFGQWAWAVGFAVTVLGAMPARLALPSDWYENNGIAFGELVVLFFLLLGAQFSFVTVLHGIMFAWRRPTLDTEGQRKVTRFGRGPFRRTARAIGLGVAFLGVVTLQVIAMAFLSDYMWGEDLKRYGIPMASTLLLVGMGLYWLGAAPGTRRWFRPSSEGRPKARVLVVAEEDA